MTPARFDALAGAYLAALLGMIERTHGYMLRKNETADDYALDSAAKYLGAVQAHGVNSPAAADLVNLESLRTACAALKIDYNPAAIAAYLEGVPAAPAAPVVTGL